MWSAFSSLAAILENSPVSFQFNFGKHGSMWNPDLLFARGGPKERD
jgi:hypothetical protein